MKKNLFILGAILLFANLKAQETTNSIDYENSIEFNPLSAVISGNFEFSYERAISEQSTLSLGVGIKPSGGLLKIKGFDSNKIKTNDFQFKGFSITPEYRWYFQNNKRTGLYLGGYYKFKRLKDHITGVYNSSNNSTSSPLDITSTLTSHTIGAEFGYKVMVSKHLYFDILIAGPGYSSAKLDIKSNKPLPPEFYEDAAEAIIDNIEVASDLIKNIETIETNDNSGELKLGLPAFRYGLKIGYTF